MPSSSLAALSQASKGRVKNYQSKHKLIDLDVWSFNIRIRGDVKIVFYDWDALGEAYTCRHLAASSSRAPGLPFVCWSLDFCACTHPALTRHAARAHVCVNG